MQTSETRQAIVGGGLLILFGVMMLIQEYVELGAWIWVAVMIVSGLAVYAVYAMTRTEAWMLIVSYSLLVIGIMIALITLDILQDSIIATYVLTAIAIPFVYGFFRTGRENWGLLIPAYVMLAVGVMVPLIESGALSDTTIPAYIMFAIALPFFVVFYRDTSQRWGLFVGGILAIVGVTLLIASDLFEYVLPVVLILLGTGILVRQITRRDTEEAPKETV